MGITSRDMQITAPDFSPISKQQYDFWDVLSAASSMTVTGIAASNLGSLRFDQAANDYFTKNLGFSGNFQTDDNYYKTINREAILGYLPQMDKQREQLNQNRLSSKEIRYLLDAESFSDFSIRKQTIDKQAFAVAVMKDSPAATLGSAMALSMFEPWNVGTWPFALVKAGSRAASAARLAAVGAGITTAEELYLQQNDVNRNLGDSLVTIGLATALNGAIGAKLSRSRSISNKQLKDIEDHIKSIDLEDRVVIDLDNVLDDATPETLNINLVEDAKELNKVLNEIEGVGIKTAEKIIEIRNSKPNKMVERLDDFLTEDLDPRTAEKISRVIGSKKIYAVGTEGDLAAPIASDTIVGSYGIDKIASITSPLVRLLKSPFPEVRQEAQRLLTVPFLTTKNLDGIPTPISLEQILDKNRRHGNHLVESFEESYYQYLYPDGTGGEFARSRAGRVFKETGRLITNVATANFKQLAKSPTGMNDKMSFDAFKKAALEHHTGAVISTDQNVINAAQSIKKFFAAEEEKVKNLLQHLNPSKENPWIDKVVYTHRIYNKAKIAENPAGFEEFLFDQLMKEYKTVKNIEAEMQASVKEVRTSFRESIDKLIKTPEERIDLQKVFDPTKRGASHNRYWHFVKDEDLYKTDYVVKDIEAITNSYITNILADADFLQHYNTIDINNIINNIEKNIIKKYGTPVEPKNSYDKIGKDAENILTPDQETIMFNDLEILKAMMQRVRGTYLSVNSPVPGGSLQNTIDNVKKFNSLRLGGSFALNSIPDVGRSIMFLGMAKAYGPLMKAYLFRNKTALEAYKRSARELKSINVANEVIFSSIISTMTNTSINSFSKNKFTDILNKNHNSFFILNGLSLWNQFMKTNAGIGVLDQIIESSRLVHLDRPVSRKKLANFAKLGLSEDDLRMIWKEHQNHGASYQGIHLMNFENWSEEAMKRGPGGLSLADKVQLAIKKEVDTIIVTPGIGDTPLIMENSWIQLLTQFKAYPIAAIVRQTLPLAQNPDNKAFLGLLVSTSAAFASAQFNAYASGREYNEDAWASMLFEAVEKTGTLSTIGEVNNYYQNITSGNPMMFGPTASIIPDFLKVQEGLMNEQGMNPYEERAAKRLLPYGGLIGLLSKLPLEAVETLTE